MGGILLMLFSIVLGVASPFAAAISNTGASVLIAIWIVVFILFIIGFYYAIVGIRRSGLTLIHEFPKESKEENHVKEIETKESKKVNEPLAILKIRYAKGEITKHQYDQMKKELE